MLTKRSNAIRDILLASEEEIKELARSLLISKSVRIQTEYMGTLRTRMTVYAVPVDITENRLGAYFSNFGLVEAVSPIMSKACITTGDFVPQVTMDRKCFLDIHDTRCL